MNDREFIDAYAEVAKVNRTRAAQLVKYFKALIIAGVHSDGTVNLSELGTFRAVWWRPVGKLADSGMQPANHLKFRASKYLIARMTRWAGCPGMSRKTRNVTRAGHDRSTLDQPIQEQET